MFIPHRAMAMPEPGRGSTWVSRPTTVPATITKVLMGSSQPPRAEFRKLRSDQTTKQLYTTEKSSTSTGPEFSRNYEGSIPARLFLSNFGSSFRSNKSISRRSFRGTNCGGGREQAQIVGPGLAISDAVDPMMVTEPHIHT